MEKSQSNMDRREEQLSVHEGQLSKRIHEMAKIRRKIAEERLLCTLLRAQVLRDRAARGGLRAQEKEKVDAKRAEYLRKMDAQAKKEEATKKKRDEDRRAMMFQQLDQFTSVFPQDYEPDVEFEEDGFDYEAAEEAMDAREEQEEEEEEDMFD
jgi:hypothetical protein